MIARKQRVRSNSTEVARLAGVSIAAVSRAFTPGSSISPEMAEKVHAAARQLKYVPNKLARSLITRETNIVALMLPNMANPIFAAILSEASQRLEEIGKQVLLFTPPRIEDFDNSLQRMLQYQVDAIFIAAASISSRMASLCLDRHVPVVMIGRHLPGLPVHNVRSDEMDAGRRAAELMLQGGGKRFGIITGPDVLSTILERQNSIQLRLAQDGLGPAAIRDGHLTYDGGYRAALDIMQETAPPDSLLCLTDVMALGAMDAIRHKLRLRVPEDVAVMGFDDIAEANHASYLLSTLRTPVPEMIGHAIELIGRPVGMTEPVALKLPAQLMVRTSTRAISCRS